MSTAPGDVLVSIVTVCYNAAELLPMTMESVLAQDYNNYEYIIKDGGSTDNTEEIVLKYAKRFKEKNICLNYISDEDTGIYDAMNIAVTSCSGKWINFMNAGDCFYNETVLSEIFKKTYPSSAILYGDCVEYEYGRFYLFPKDYDKILSAMPFSHQAVFANRELLSRYPFKTRYHYSADYDFLLTAHDLELHFTDVDCVVCITNKDGVSSVNYHDMLDEGALIRKVHNLPIPSAAEADRIEKSLTIKQYVLDHFPVFIKKFIRGIQIKYRGQSFNCIVPYWYNYK